MPHQSGLGIEPSGAADAGALAPAPAPVGLPCLNSNSSNKEPKKYRLQKLNGVDDYYTTKDNKSAVWEELDNDTIKRWGKPSSAEAKSAFHLRLNVASFVEHYGRDHCLFFTVTDEDNLHPTQFARRWNSFLVRNGAWIRSYIRVLEPQKQGRPHYHLLVAVEWDTLPDRFDWEAFDGCEQERRKNGSTPKFRKLRSCYKNSAASELVSMWSQLRKVLPRYGLGRSELLPLRKGKEAISAYIGKYLEAGLTLRKHSWKGCRRVEFSKRDKDEWLSCSRVFAWHSSNAKQWRIRVGEIGYAIGVTDISEMKEILGSRWAYHLRESITCATDEDWRDLLAVILCQRFNVE